MEDEKRRFDWHDPMSPRGRTVVIVIAAIIVVGAVVTGLSLGISFF